MNLQLTDILTCPRCQEGGGLILLAERVDGRRVLAGQLGCPGCRARYPVADGEADFTTGEDFSTAPGGPVDAARVAALLGVTEGPAQVMVMGNHSELAQALVGLIPDIEVVVVSRSSNATGEVAGVSRLRIAERIPLRDRSVRGVVINGSDAELISEAVRVIGLAARVVLIGATAAARDALHAQAVHVLAEQDDTLVAVRHS